MTDIIGDIHGYAEVLRSMLTKLGYVLHKGSYRHPQGRRLIFVGDLIDRGPQIREVVQLVRRLCQEGTARVVMGNHEYNAICFHTPHRERGGFFRHHSLKEIKQHIQTLESYQRHDSEWADTLEWFRTLPLFIEEDGFRVVHACWHASSIQWLKAHAHPMDPAFLSRCTDDTDVSGAYAAVECTLKGPELRLAGDQQFTDKDGNVRSNVRLRWWATAAERQNPLRLKVNASAEWASQAMDMLPHGMFYEEPKPVFFGHYALQETPGITNSNAICLDYHVTRGGGLVAARWHLKAGNPSFELVCN